MAVQSNQEHQQGVAEKAESFAAEFDMGDFGRIMGLLHDKGKEQKEWQEYIKGTINHGPHHAYVGACIAQKQYPQIAPLIAQPIAGHHRGLYDYCNYEEVIKSDVPDDITIKSLHRAEVVEQIIDNTKEIRVLQDLEYALLSKISRC